jgi:hypothetical protein
MCRRAVAVTKERILWLTLYRHICTHLPPIKLPGADPKLVPSEQLEEITIRMARLDYNWTRPQPIPISQQVLVVKTPTLRTKVHEMTILPGGRWLLTLTKIGVTLWDLDRDPTGKTRPKRIVAKLKGLGSKVYQRTMMIDCRGMPEEFNLLTTQHACVTTPCTIVIMLTALGWKASHP